MELLLDPVGNQTEDDDPAEVDVDGDSDHSADAETL